MKGFGWLVAGLLLAGLSGSLATGVVGPATGAYGSTTGSTGSTASTNASSTGSGNCFISFSLCLPACLWTGLAPSRYCLPIV